MTRCMPVTVVASPAPAPAPAAAGAGPALFRRHQPIRSQRALTPCESRGAGAVHFSHRDVGRWPWCVPLGGGGPPRFRRPPVDPGQATGDRPLARPGRSLAECRRRWFRPPRLGVRVGRRSTPLSPRVVTCIDPCLRAEAAVSRVAWSSADFRLEASRPTIPADFPPPPPGAMHPSGLRGLPSRVTSILPSPSRPTFVARLASLEPPSLTILRRSSLVPGPDFRRPGKGVRSARNLYLHEAIRIRRGDRLL